MEIKAKTKKEVLEEISGRLRGNTAELFNILRLYAGIAYDEGLKAGRESGFNDVKVITAVTELTKSEVEKEKKESYQKGLNDAWEVVRKIACYDSPLHDNDLTQIFGLDNYSIIFSDFSVNDAMEAIALYEKENSPTNSDKFKEVFGFYKEACVPKGWWDEPYNGGIKNETEDSEA